MKFPLPLDTFPRVACTTQDEQTLRNLTAALVRDTLQEFAAHEQQQQHLAAVAASAQLRARVSQRVLPASQQIGDSTTAAPAIDAARWQLLKRRDNVRVYKERTSFHAAQLEREWQYNRPPPPPRDPFRTTGDAAATAPSSINRQRHVLPMMIGIGTVQGSVHDVLYGLLAHTPAAAQLRAAYVHDDVVDTHVLATLVQPTTDAPLTSLALKWLVKRHHGGRVARSLVRFRDFVVLEATGITTSSTTGECIGYHVIHSVAVPGVRELHERNVVRAKISIVCLFRQQLRSYSISNSNSEPTGTMELFMRGFLNPLGDVPLRRAMASAAETVLALFKAVRCAQMKKLTHVVQTRCVDQTQTQQSAACAVCWRTARRDGLQPCAVCARRLCLRCSVEQTLYYVVPTAAAGGVVSTALQASTAASLHVAQTTVRVCASCVYGATQTCPKDLAVCESNSTAHVMRHVQPPQLLSTRSRAFTSPTSGSSHSCASSSVHSAVTTHAAQTPSRRSSRFSR